MPERSPACPLCESSAPKAFLHNWKDYSWWDCPACGIAFVIPFASPGADFYADFMDLYPHEAQETTDPMSFEYDECLAYFGSSPVVGRKLLDVGCGGGGFLNRAQQRGFSVAGLDFNAARLKRVGEKLGHTALYAGSLPDYAAAHPEERFDVITLFQVIEHLDRPADWLKAALQLLTKRGHLFIGTPNRDRTANPFQGPGMEEVDNPPNHLTRWRAASLRGLVEGCGFHVVEVKSLAVPLPLFCLMLRNRLRFGLATSALKVDQLQHAASSMPGSATQSLKRRFIETGVKGKELLINSMGRALYPFFRLGFLLFGGQGVVLYCVAEKR